MKKMRSAASQERIPVRAGESRRERHRAEIRQRLYRAALKLFAERGFLGTTVEDITEAADVGKGTFFNYFPTKEHVLAAFGMERVAAIEQAYEKARVSPGGVLPILRELTTNLAGQWKESPALLRAIYAAHASCAPVRAELLKRVRKGRQIIARIFSLAQARGEVRRDIPATELARLTQLVFMGVTLGWAMNPEGSIRKTSEEVWEFFSSDFRAHPHKLRSGQGPKTAAMKW